MANQYSTKAELLRAGFKGYEGWSDESAIMADYRATGGSGKYDPGPTSGLAGGGGAGENRGPTSIPGAVQSAQQQLTQANQPAIESYQATRPEISSRFAGYQEQLTQKGSDMKQRYANLLDSMKGRETKETTQASRLHQQSMARRGIDARSQFYQEEQERITDPISEYYGGLTRDIGQQQSEEATGLANLSAEYGYKETEEQRLLTQAITALQGETAVQGMQFGLQTYQIEQAGREAKTNREFQLKLTQMGMEPSEAEKLAREQFEAGQWKQPYEEALYKKQLEPSGPTATDKSTAVRGDILGAVKDGASLQQVIQMFGNKASVNDIVKLYSGASPMGAPQEKWTQQILGIGTDW